MRHAVLLIFSIKLWGLHSESETWGGGGEWECVDQKFLNKSRRVLKPQLQYIYDCVWKYIFKVFVTSSPFVSALFSLSLTFSSYGGVSLSLCLSLLFLPLSLSLSVSLSLLLVGIHFFSWPARSCDPPAKNQTVLPTARLAHKETGMLTHTRTHTHYRHTHTLGWYQCYEEKDCSIRPPHTLSLKHSIWLHNEFVRSVFNIYCYSGTGRHDV